MCVCLMLSVVGCAGQTNPGMERQCAQGLDIAYRELDFAKAKGFGGTVDWAKAATLLAAAKTQQQFEKYPNCVEKVKRARFYIKRSQVRR